VGTKDSGQGISSKLDLVGLQEVGKSRHCKSRGLYFFIWKEVKVNYEPDCLYTGE
jgi:hypothetical protein